MWTKHLNRPLFTELNQALLQLFAFHRIGQFDDLEHLGREERQARKLQIGLRS